MTQDFMAGGCTLYFSNFSNRIELYNFESKRVRIESNLFDSLASLTFCILTLQTQVVQTNFFIPPLVYPDVTIFWSTNFSSLPFQWCETQYRNRKLSAKDISEFHALFTRSIWPITNNVKR